MIRKRFLLFIVLLCSCSSNSGSLDSTSSVDASHSEESSIISSNSPTPSSSEVISSDESILSSTSSNLSIDSSISSSVEEKFPMNINIKIEDYLFTIELEENQTTKELVTYLREHNTFNFQDLNDNEKYCYLDTRFTTSSRTVDYIEKGDFMLYGSSCLVIFYESFSSAYAYTRLGKIKDVTNISKLSNYSSVKVIFEIE